MMIVWGRHESSNVAKVLWTLTELGLPFERIDAGGRFGGTTTPEYRAMNPNGRIPTLRDGDVTVWESNAIVRYLGAKYGDGVFWPTDPAERSNSDRWMDWASLTLSPAVKRLMAAKSAPDDFTAASEAAMPIIDTLAGALEGRQFIGGDKPSIGDIPIGPWIRRWCKAVEPTDAYQEIFAYYARLCQRAGYRTHIDEPAPASLLQS